MSFKVAEIKALDGEILNNVLSVKFLNDPILHPHLNNQIEVEVKFNSPKPISTDVKLTFTDEQNTE